MADDTRVDADGEANDDLRAVIAAQQAELDELRSRLAGVAPSRRSLLKGAGAVAGGLAALGAVSATSGSIAKPSVAGAIEGHNVKYGTPGLIYAAITGQKQGVIKGGVIQKGREGQIACNYFQHKVKSPRDLSSGMATGQRQYDTVVIRKEIDKSTPLITNALINNENLTSAVFNFWRPSSSTGTEVNYFRVALTNASLVSQNWYSPDSLQGGATGAGDLPMEEIHFVFQRIEWTWVDGGITAMDDWESPTA